MRSRIEKFINKLWNSSTLMTWLNLLAKSLSLVLVTPLVLSKFDNPEIALWLLIASALSLQNMADLGFATTFVRFLSYARKGMQERDIESYFLDKKVVSKDNIDKPNWTFINSIFYNMKYTYRWLALVAIIFMVLSTFLLYKPISLISSPVRGWIAWGIILFSSVVILQGSIYRSFLLGMNKVAITMRIAAVFGFLTVVSNFTVLLMGGDILLLVCSNQIGLLLGVLGSYLLCYKVENNIFKTFKKKAKYTANIFRFAWGSAWKSGLGVFMSFGVQQIANLIIGQENNSIEIASFLLAFMFIRQISQFSQAPFYSKAPLLAQYYVKNNRQGIIKLAQYNMSITYWLILIGCLFLIIFIDPILFIINSDVPFISPIAWWLLVFGILIERYGAMHIQLYSISHDIIWHKANSITGVIFIGIFSILYLVYDFGYYAFIAAFIISNLAFYSWYSAKYSYQLLGTTFWKFEKKVFIPALIFAIMIMVTIYFITEYRY
jgi:O-antigen/teichoic acid export membrane protein